MYDIVELNNKSIEDLKEIAKELKISKISVLKKQELIYQILDHQAINPQPIKKQDKINENKMEESKEDSKGSAKSKKVKLDTVEPDADETTSPLFSDAGNDVDVPPVTKAAIDPNTETPIASGEPAQGDAINADKNREGFRRYGERRVQESLYNFDGIVVSEGVLEIMPMDMVF